MWGPFPRKKDTTDLILKRKLASCAAEKILDSLTVNSFKTKRKRLASSKRRRGKHDLNLIIKTLTQERDYNCGKSRFSSKLGSLLNFLFRALIAYHHQTSEHRCVAKYTLVQKYCFLMTSQNFTSFVAFLA